MPVQVDDELDKYAVKKPASDDELARYAAKPAEPARRDDLEEYLNQPANYGTSASTTHDELPGATPRLKAITGGKATKPVTDLEKKTGSGDLTEGAASSFWDKLKGMAPSDPTGGHSPFEKEFWLGTPTHDVAHGGLATAADEAGHEYERARKAGSGIIPSIGTAGVVGAGSLLGVSNKEEEEQAEHGESGKILGGALAPAAVAATAPLVGPALETGARGVRAGLIRPISDTLADRFATPAVAPGLSDAAKANLIEPLARRGTEKVLRATGLPSGEPKLRESFAVAAPDLAEIERENPIEESGSKGGIIRPDMRVRQTVDNIDKHLQKLWNDERQPQIDRNAALPTVTRQELLGDATPEEAAQVERKLRTEIPEQVNLGEADELLRKVNARLRKAEGGTPEAMANALELSGMLDKLHDMKGILHENIGGLLERVGEPGIKEFNRRYGALSEVRDALRNRMNPVEAERVLDSVRATGGLGRNVNLFERLHLKASPGRLAQKGLEDLARSGLQTPTYPERPPTAGLLPAPPTPAGGPVDMGGSVRGGRWTTPRGLIGGIPPIEGEYIPPEEGAKPPLIHSIEVPSGVATPFRVEAPRMRSGTIPPIEPASSSTILPGGAAVRDIKLLPGGAEPAPVPPAEAPKPTIKPLEPLKNVKPILPEPEPVAEPETEEVHIKGLTAPEPKAKTARAKAVPVEKRFSRDEIEQAEGMLASEAGALSAADKPGVYYDKTEAGEFTYAGRRATPGMSSGGGGAWRGVSTGRDMYPFMRENPKLSPSEIQKALRNKDSAAYNRLIEKAVDFNRRNAPPVDEAYNFLRDMGENPDTEPETGYEPEFNPEEIEKTETRPAAPEPSKTFDALKLIEALNSRTEPERGVIPPAEIAEKGGILPGMEEHVERQNGGAAAVAGENLTAQANQPKDISAAAGRMETLSPLFRGTEASPQREIFGSAQNTPQPATQVPPPIEEALKDTGWNYEGKNDLGLYTIKEPGTNIRISLFERDLNPNFIRRKIAEKEKQFGVPTQKNEKTSNSGGSDLEGQLKEAGNSLTEASKQHKAGTISDEDYMKARKAHDDLLAKWEAARGEAPPKGAKLKKFLK